MTALELPQRYYEQLTADYAAKRDLFLGYLDEAGLSYTTPQGAYYVMVDCSAFGVTDDVSFCRWMARTVGVAAVPGSSFFHEPVHQFVRLHFSRSEEILAETGRRLKKLNRWFDGGLPSSDRPKLSTSSRGPHGHPTAFATETDLSGARLQGGARSKSRSSTGGTSS